MKKVFAIALALALAVSLALTATAAAADDLKKVLNELSETVGPEALKAAFEEAWADVSKKLDIKAEDAKDAGKLPAETGSEVAAGLIEKLNLKDTDIATKIQESMSNDFVSFLCGMYTGDIKKPPVTGDSSSSVIAIATFAALSAVAAAAFVCMKKKDA